MQISNIEEWRLFQIHNTSWYGRTIMNFSQAWANKMEEMMNVSPLNLFIIKESFHTVFNSKEIARNQTSAALEVLLKCWKYGQKLGDLLNEISPNNDFNPFDSWSGRNANESIEIRSISNGATRINPS